MFANEKQFIEKLRKLTAIIEPEDRYNAYLMLREEIAGDKSEQVLLLILQQYFPTEAYYELNEYKKEDILTFRIIAQATDNKYASDPYIVSRILETWKNYGFTNDHIETYHDLGYTIFRIAKDLYDLGITPDSSFFYNSDLVAELFESRNYNRDLRNIEYAFEQWLQYEEDDQFREQEE